MQFGQADEKRVQIVFTHTHTHTHRGTLANTWLAIDYGQDI